MTPPSQRSTESKTISPGEAFWLWLKIGVLSFGGPAGQIALMHRTIVDEKRWLSEPRFLHALNYCMLLPGPEAQQLTVYVGWLLHGIRGGLIAGLLFIIPGAIVIWILSVLYASYSDLPAVDGLFFGVKAAVLAIVLQAITRLATRVVRKPALVALALFGFVATFFFHLPFPLVVLGAAAAGWVIGKFAPTTIMLPAAHGEGADDGLTSTGSKRNTLGAAAVFAVLWIVPVIALFALLGPTHVYTQESLFFSKLAVVTFGGAYAVLAYMTQQVVSGFGWLSTGQMIDGLGMAETTPGPLILVTQFVGFMAAYQNPGTLDPLLAGTLGAAITLWVTFVPCFLWIFLGAPFVENLRASQSISAALSAITAVVVGVIASLALWFATHVLFGETYPAGSGPVSVELPVLSSLDIAGLALTTLCVVLLLRVKLSVLWILLISALAGIAWRTLV